LGRPGYDSHVLFGRDDERAAIGALLAAARASESGALVVRGEAGIGKTALLADALDRAADMHVLSARGVESESELPFAALHQLLRPVLGHLEKLPAPQATALRGALGLQEGVAEE
jgi:predicted ATPase